MRRSLAPRLPTRASKLRGSSNVAEDQPEHAVTPPTSAERSSSCGGRRERTAMLELVCRQESYWRAAYHHARLAEGGERDSAFDEWARLAKVLDQMGTQVSPLSLQPQVQSPVSPVSHAVSSPGLSPDLHGARLLG